MPTNVDPKNVNARLYNQISKLLDDLDKPVKKKKAGTKGTTEEPLSIRERIAALVAIGRLQLVFMNLRREGGEDGRDTGSAVRKYKAAFANDRRGRKAAAGRASEPEPDGDDDPFSGIGDDDDAA